MDTDLRAAKIDPDAGAPENFGRLAGLMAKGRNDRPGRHCLAVGLTQLGNALFVQGRTDQAVKWNREGLDHARF